MEPETISETSVHSKEVAGGSFWNLIGSILLKLVSFFYVVLLARAASADDVGIFYLALSIIGLISVFSDIGLPASLQRYIPFFEGRKEKDKVFGTLKINYVVVGAISAILTALVWWQADTIANIYQNAQLAETIRILSVYILLQNVFRINTSYLQGKCDMKSCQYLVNLQNVVKLIFTVILFYLYGPSVIMITAAFVASFLVAALWSFYFIRDDVAKLSRTSLLMDKELRSEIIPFGIMLTILNSFWIVVSSSDKILMGYLIPSAYALEAVAIYSMATNASYILSLFSGAIEAISFPVMSRLVGQNNLAQVLAVIGTSQRWVAFITIPTSLVFIVFSSDILGMVYGNAYRAGAIVMALITFGLLIRSFVSIPAMALAAMRRVDLELKIIVLTAVLNLVLNVLFIPLYGIEGSALATLASFVFMFFLFAYYANKIFNFVFPVEIYKLAITGVVAFIIVLLLKTALSFIVLPLPILQLVQWSSELSPYLSKFLYLAYLGFLTALSVLIFGCVSLVFKCFHNEDISMLKTLLLKFRIPTQLISLTEKIALYGVPRGT
jgi:O-antigen/teichoic acid export membrane protein